MTTATPRPKPMAPRRSLKTIEEQTKLNVIAAKMEITGNPVLIELVGENVSTLEKPKFIVQPHLTERPLKGHEGLMALRQQLESETPKRSGQSRTHKEKK